LHRWEGGQTPNSGRTIPSTRFLGRSNMIEGGGIVGSIASTASGPHLSEGEKQKILDQLHRVLESSWFRTSQRSSALVRHLVEETLNGRTEGLKQRRIAIEVFHRASGFDTDADPVVRIAAGDARKRLAQYYDDPENTGQIRIELPIGAYVPVFRFPNLEILTEQRPEPVLSTSRPQELPLPVDLDPGHSGDPKPGSEIQRHWFRWKGATLAAAILLFVATAGWWVAVHSGRPAAGFDAFWTPIVSAQAQPLISIGEFVTKDMEFEPNGQRNPSRTSAVTVWKFGEKPNFPHALKAMTFDNVQAATKVAGVLGAKNRSIELRGEADTSFADLSNRPVILIGAWDNDWVIRITENMRFRFASDVTEQLQWIQDREKPSEKIGLRSYASWPPVTAEDFCIVARSTDPSTGQPVVLISGLTYMSTSVAAQFASDPKFLNDFARGAPKDWARKNVEFLVASNRVDGAVGPPRIVAYSLW
jgi:hypothetical protein